MGAVAFAQSVVSYFSLAALLGIQYYGVRACAAVRDNKAELSKTVKEILVILLMSTSLVFLVYCLCLFIVPQFINERVLFIEFGLTIWLSAFGVEWFYQALEQYGYITIRNVLFKLVSLILMFVFVTAKEDYIIYGAIVIFAGSASNLLNMLRLRKLVDFRTKQKLNIKRHLKPMKWFAVAAVSSGMYTQIDIVLLGFLGTTNMVGIYQLVSKIKSVLVPAVNAVGSVVLPRLSYFQAKQQQKQIGILISKNINFALVMGIAIISELVMCAKPIVLILGGANYIDSAIPLMLVSPAILFSALNIVLGNHMISGQKERTWALVNVIGLMIAVLSNIVLIPFLGVNGAAISISLCEFCMLTMRCFASRSFLVRIHKHLDPIKIVFCAAAALAAGFGVLVFIDSVHSLSQLLVCTGVFGLCYITLLILTKEMFTYSLWQNISGRFRNKKENHRDK
jgi:O-antigen/teichoic acid export membrane protein